MFQIMELSYSIGEQKSKFKKSYFGEIGLKASEILWRNLSSLDFCLTKVLDKKSQRYDIIEQLSRIKEIH